jgi:hypothetical protein
MPIAVQNPQTDLLLPLPPPGATWDPWTVHTYYLGFTIPEAAIGVVVYHRFLPHHPLCGGGVGIYRGTQNVRPLDVDHLDWWLTMPWPAREDSVLRMANGVEIEVVRPGEELRVRYASRDRSVRIDVRLVALTPLTVRGSLMPALEGSTDADLQRGGSEQFMHVTGELVLHGDTFAVDCVNVRDRSWRQVRPEGQGIVAIPPLCWTPVCFGPGYAFNAFSMEAPDAHPSWAGVYDVAPGAPTHQGVPYVLADGELREVVRVRREVLEHHPQTFQATRQVVEAVDEAGREHRFEGVAIASASLPMWPTIAFTDSVFRWEDAQGRVTHGSCQEAWFDGWQRAMKARALERTGVVP